MRGGAAIAFSMAALAFAQSANAASVTFGDVRYRYPTHAEIAGGVPVDAKIRNFFLTTDADIISIGFLRIDTNGTIYQHPGGSNAEPPNPLLIPFLPALAADSWITTPGLTSILGVDMPGDGTANSAWGDLQNTGPVANFRFARLTISPASANYSFDFEVTIATPAGPASFTPFLEDFASEILVPELASLGLSGIAFFGLAAYLRQLAKRVASERG
jgi:hypothetical protein